MIFYTPKVDHVINFLFCFVFYSLFPFSKEVTGGFSCTEFFFKWWSSILAFFFFFDWELWNYICLRNFQEYLYYHFWERSWKIIWYIYFTSSTPDAQVKPTWFQEVIDLQILSTTSKAFHSISCSPCLSFFIKVITVLLHTTKTAITAGYEKP